MSDITVFGLVSGSHFVEDIQTLVPHGAQITIPAEKALRSKDLWRAISSRQLFQIRMTPNAHPIPPPLENATASDLRAAQLELENRELKDQFRRQQEELSFQQITSQQAISTMQQQLDTIVQLLRSGVVSAPVMSAATGVPVKTLTGVVETELPMFIPSTITPEGADSHIETKTEEAQNSGLSDAAGKLRSLRQKKA